MSSSAIETRKNTFHCIQVQREVCITQTIKIHRGRPGQDDLRVSAGYDCSHRDRCSISSRKGASTSYEWAHCECRKRDKS